MIAQAHLYFVKRNEKGQLRESQYDIIYEADSPKSAIDDAYRWAANRIKCLPYIFGFLGCCKVSEYRIGKVGKKGSLMTGGSMDFHEWKYDWYPENISIHITENHKMIGEGHTWLPKSE